MTTSITFRGGETTGSVSDRKIETAKQETTGGVGARKNQGSIFTIDNELKQDTVCFRAKKEDKNKTSPIGALALATGIAIVGGGLLGIAHKKNWFGNIENEKIRNLFKHSDKITEPCYKACSWVKRNCYDKIANLFKNNK